MGDFLTQYYPEIIIFCSILLSLIFSLMKTKLLDLMNFVFITGLFLLTLLLVLKKPFFVDPDPILIKGDFTHFLKFITLLCFIVIAALLRKGLGDFQIEIKEFPIFLLSSLLGAFLLICANDLLFIFLSLELLSLSTYVMCAMFHKFNDSTEAAMKYVILGALGTAFFVFGAAFIYGGSHTFSLYDMSMNMRSQTDVSLLLRLGCVFIIISLLLKISIAPFHLWLPDIFQGTPLAVVTFISTIPKIAAFGVLIRLLYGPFELLYQDWKPIIAICSLLSIGWGTFAALHQKNLKRLLAYSSISHMGFVILPLMNQNVRSLQASVTYFSFYILVTLGIFGMLLWFKRLGHNIQDIKNLALVNRSYPTLMALLSLLFISLSGVPPFSGFFVKLYVIASFFENKESIVSVLICSYLLVMSIIGTYYYLNIIKEIYFNDLPRKTFNEHHVDDFLGLFITVSIAIMGITFFWIPPLNQYLGTLISQAVSSLMMM
jgi:NADH-quinone oxidoreductase subunit N